MNQIRVLLSRENDYWVAQCLEYDIGAQATDLIELRKRLIAAIEAERQESLSRQGAEFAGVPEAPAIFRSRWEECAGTFTPKIPARIPDGRGIDLEFGLAA